MYDSNRKPVSVKHAHDFVILDEGDIELRQLSLYNVLYRADLPLRFHVTYDAEGQLYDLDGDFEISLSANSRPQLLQELNEVLSMLWIDYAQEEPERFSPKARDLGRAKSTARWHTSLRDYAVPQIGRKRCHGGPVTDLVDEAGNRESRPAAHRRGHEVGRDAISAALSKNSVRRPHQNALPFAQVAEALGRVRASKAPRATALAFEFLVSDRLPLGRDPGCTMRRGGRRGDHLDRATGAHEGEVHRVPLSSQAVAVLDEAREIADRSGLVFPSPTGRILSDSTKLLGPTKWTYFHLYVVLDIFSRYAVGWMVADRENSALAGRLIEDTCHKQGVQPQVLTLHSDRSAPMTSKCTAQLLADLGVTRSLSRPQVSDDNPFSEAQFKTLKYHPGFPGRFHDIAAAIAFCRTFFPWYNTEHRHGGIAMLTPDDVHHHRTRSVLDQRGRTLQAAWTRHPERFVRGIPQPDPLPQAVWINPPVTSTTGDTVQ